MCFSRFGIRSTRRSLTPEASGFAGLLSNRTFLAIAGTIAVVQALIISVPFLAAVFQVEPLGCMGLAVHPGGHGLGVGFRRNPAARPTGVRALGECLVSLGKTNQSVTVL